jgi:hypothetical protein
MRWIPIEEAAMKTLVAKLVKAEEGGELCEFALVAGILLVTCIAIVLGLRD